MDNNTKKLVIIAVSVFVLIIFGLVAVLSGRDKPVDDNRGLPEGAEVTIDKDTGDEIVHVPGKDKEQFLSDDPMILGGDSLLDNTSLTYDQYGVVVDIVTGYAKNNIGNVSTIKFLPDTIKDAPEGDVGDYKVTIKTVGPENILEVIINAVGLNRVRVYIHNTTQSNLGMYDSGIVPDPNSHSEEDIEGDSDTGEELEPLE